MNLSKTTYLGFVFAFLLFISFLSFFIFSILLINSIVNFFIFKKNKDKQSLITKNIRKNFLLLIISLIVFFIIDKIGLILGLFMLMPGLK